MPPRRTPSVYWWPGIVAASRQYVNHGVTLVRLGVSARPLPTDEDAVIEDPTDDEDRLFLDAIFKA